jgi:ferredoxin
LSDVNSCLTSILSDVNSCVKCGVCKAGCVLYKFFRDETWSPRGKAILTEAFARGRLGASELLDNILNRCLYCGQCTLECPKGIETFRLFSAERYLLLREKSLLSDEVVESDFSDKYPTSHPISGNIPDKFSRHIYVGRGDIIVGLYPGCVGNHLFQEHIESLVQLIGQSPVKEIVLLPFECCGLYAFFRGDWPRFYAIMRDNLRILGQEKDLHCVITACMDCKFALKVVYPLFCKHGGCLQMKVFSPLAFFSAHGIDIVPGETRDFILGRHRYTDFFVEESATILDLAKHMETKVLDIITGYEGTLWSKDPLSAELITCYLEKQLLSGANTKTIVVCSLDDVFNLSRTQMNVRYIVEFLGMCS